MFKQKKKEQEKSKRGKKEENYCILFKCRCQLNENPHPTQMGGGSLLPLFPSRFYRKRVRGEVSGLLS